MTAEINVFLTLRGARLTPEIARERIGLEPDRLRMPPGHGEHSRAHVKEPWCAYQSGLGLDRNLDEHVGALLDRLAPYQERILAMREELGLTILIDAVVECYEGFTPPIFLEPELVQRMSGWRAAFWIDLYTFDGPPNPTDTRGT